MEDDDGGVIEVLDQPRASFAGHTLQTPWMVPQLAYFFGTAMWTYLTQPFTFTLSGFETTELEPWRENGEQWRRLRVVWPSHLASLDTVLTIYVGDDYMSGYTRVAGIMIPTGHRILSRTPEGQALTEPLLISIDLSEIAFA
jgi:hypothetical protein